MKIYHLCARLAITCTIRHYIFFRETLSKEDKWLSYFKLDDIMKNTKNLDGDINYRLLKAQCSQQVLRILDKNIKSYYKSVQDYKKTSN